MWQDSLLFLLQPTNTTGPSANSYCVFASHLCHILNQHKTFTLLIATSYLVSLQNAKKPVLKVSVHLSKGVQLYPQTPLISGTVLQNLGCHISKSGNRHTKNIELLQFYPKLWSFFAYGFSQTFQLFLPRRCLQGLNVQEIPDVQQPSVTLSYKVTKCTGNSFPKYLVDW